MFCLFEEDRVSLNHNNNHKSYNFSICNNQQRSSRQEGRRPVESLWTEVKDENSGLTYWWNEETDETTEVGAAKPMTYSISQDPWIEVKDPQTDQIYYWNQITDETTAIGEPKPDPTYGRQHVDMGHNQSMADGLKQSMV